MDQVTPAAEILSFPQTTRIDERLLETVLNNMSQGVLLFDAETRLIFCNQRYCEMYGLVSEFARPGRFLRDLLVQRIQSGTFAEDPDEYIVRLKEGVAAGSCFTHTVTLPDGRAFCVVNKALEGGGWVATHEDITERQRSEVRIAHDSTVVALETKKSAAPFKHGGKHVLNGLALFSSYHCSRYNTNTGVLTPEMFRDVFKAVRRLLGP